MASGAAVTLLSIEPAEQLPYGRVIRDAIRRRDRDRRGAATPPRSSARCASSTRRSTSSRAVHCGTRSSRSTRTTLRASSTSRTRSPTSSRAARRAAAHRSADPLTAVGINDRSELAFAAAVLRDRINAAHMLAGVDDRRSGHDLDRRRTSRSSPTRRSTRSRSFAAGRACSRAPRSGRTWSPSTPRSVREPSSGPSVTFAPARWLAAGAKAGTFVEIKNSQHRERGQGAAPLVHRRRGYRRGHERRRRNDHGELPPSAWTSRRGGRRSAATSGPGSTMGSKRRSRSATMRGSAGGSISPRTSRRSRSRASRLDR